MQHLEDQLAAGAIDHARFAVLAHAAWKDRLTEEHAQRAFVQAPWLAGMREVFADIRARGEHALVLTLGPNLFARHLTAWADHIIATPYPAPGSRDALVDEDALCPEDKVTAARQVQEQLGVTQEQTVAYGDGPTDRPLFEAAGLAVAVNPSPKLPREAARFTYHGDDLRVPYAAARAHLATAEHTVPQASPRHGAVHLPLP